MKPLSDKVLARIVVAESGCWIWQGAKNRKGYGLIGISKPNTTIYTHRIMYEDANGPIPPGMQIDHLCRTPGCCNPAHLEAVTPAENTRRGFSAERKRANRYSATHCKHGHSYDEANSYFGRNGGRSCRKCREIRNAKWTALRRETRQVYRTFAATAPNVVSIGGGKNG